jgi:hypothetical protein
MFIMFINNNAPTSLVKTKGGGVGLPSLGSVAEYTISMQYTAEYE